MSTELIDQLRSEVEIQHAEALHAIEVLAKYLSNAPSKAERSIARVAAKPPTNGRVMTQREVVIEALRKRPGADIDDLVMATRLEKGQIRGVLYAPALKDLILREVGDDGLATYRLNENEH